MRNLTGLPSDHASAGAGPAGPSYARGSKDVTRVNERTVLARLDKKCKGGRKHRHLEGKSRTEASAAYPRLM